MNRLCHGHKMPMPTWTLVFCWNWTELEKSWRNRTSYLAGYIKTLWVVLCSQYHKIMHSRILHGTWTIILHWLFDFSCTQRQPRISWLANLSSTKMTSGKPSKSWTANWILSMCCPIIPHSSGKFLRKGFSTRCSDMLDLCAFLRRCILSTPITVEFFSSSLAWNQKTWTQNYAAQAHCWSVNCHRVSRTTIQIRIYGLWLSLSRKSNLRIKLPARRNTWTTYRLCRTKFSARSSFPLCPTGKLEASIPLKRWYVVIFLVSSV